MGAADRLRPLTELLIASEEERLVLPIHVIEDLIGEPLPMSAHRHTAWWSNSTAHASAWLEAGYRCSRAGVASTEVAFVRGSQQRQRTKYGPLRDHLSRQGGAEIEMTFDEIEQVLGASLPPSARKHAAYWSNSSAIASAWTDAGFRASRAGTDAETVRFIRDSIPHGRSGMRPHTEAAVAALLDGIDEPKARPENVTTADALLIGCVASKRSAPAPAQDLYTSPLFRGRRRHAEATGKPWYVLSAEYGIVPPEEVIEPYDRKLSDQPVNYRRAWGDQVVAQLRKAFGPLAEMTFEVHAGAAYVHPLQERLTAAGAQLVHPLAGLRLGEQLSWYARQASVDQPTAASSRSFGENPADTTQSPAPELHQPSTESRNAVGAALLAHAAEIDEADPALSPDPLADQFLHDDPFAFLVAVILDQGIVAERAWTAPWLLQQRLGHWDLHRIADDPEAVQAAVSARPALHRMVKRMPAAISDAAGIVLREYSGDAATIWSDQPTVAELLRRLLRFPWVGQKKAAMAVEILSRRLHIPLRGLEDSDIAYDVHVRRVFLRSGLARHDDIDEMLAAARDLNPERPGALDIAAWDIGRRWCRPQNPDCASCAIQPACPRLIERGDDIQGM